MHFPWQQAKRSKNTYTYIYIFFLFIYTVSGQWLKKNSFGPLLKRKSPAPPQVKEKRYFLGSGKSFLEVICDVFRACLNSYKNIQRQKSTSPKTMHAAGVLLFPPSAPYPKPAPPRQPHPSVRALTRCTRPLRPPASASELQRTRRHLHPSEPMLMTCDKDSMWCRDLISIQDGGLLCCATCDVM